MKAGDIVHIYVPHREDKVDSIGIIIDIYGHKTSVLCDGIIEHWDISDLEKMLQWKLNSEKNNGN